MMKTLKFMWLLTLLAIFSLSCERDKIDLDNSSSTSEEELEATNATAVMPSKLFVKKMQPGINIGNTMDSEGPGKDETGFGNARLTQKMFTDYKNRGFKSVRIPVTWKNHVDGQNKINAAWMARVKEVVDYGLKAGLIVILNTHHEDNWLIVTKPNLSPIQNRLNTYWRQIATTFKGYNNQLVFEVFNEPRDETKKRGPKGLEDGFDFSLYTSTKKANENILKLAKGAIATIRKTGGKNATRYVAVPGLAAFPSSALSSEFNLKSVGNPNLTILSFHEYSPGCFTLGFNCPDGKPIKTWSATGGKEGIGVTNNMNRLKAKFSDFGVILGEYGANFQGNNAARMKYARHYSKELKRNGFAGFWWCVGDGKKGAKTTSLYGRLNGNQGTQGWLKEHSGVVNSILLK